MILELSADEALVLFDLLGGYGETDDGRMLVIRHAAERNALWALEGTLERQLVAPFQDDYNEQLAAARVRIEAHGGRREREMIYRNSKETCGMDSAVR